MITGAKVHMTKSQANIEDADWVERLALVIDEFRKINQDMTANQMLVLLRIGERPGITQKELSQLTQLPDGTVSRICALLSDRGHQTRRGLNAIRIHEVPGDYRVRGSTLFGNGQRLYASIRNLMTGGPIRGN